MSNVSTLTHGGPACAGVNLTGKGIDMLSRRRPRVRGGESPVPAHGGKVPAAAPRARG